MPTLTRRAARTLMLVTLVVTAPGANPVAQQRSTAASFPLEEATIDQLQSWMQSGRYTSAALTRLYLDRITTLDEAGPRVSAILEVNPDALAIAAEMDRERQAGRVRGPLHGIPVVIKD